MDVNFYIQGEIYKGYDLIIINNITVVFEGYFSIFDYFNLQKEVLKELNELKISVYNSGFKNAYEASFIGSTILDEKNKFILSHLIKKMIFDVRNYLYKY